MATLKVKAKVTGTHAMTGIYVEAGHEYEIDEELARLATEVFEPVRRPATKKDKEE